MTAEQALTSKLQDRSWVADMIRRTEEAVAAQRQLLGVLYAAQAYECEASAVQPGDLLDRWGDGAWAPVVSSEKCTLDDCWRIGFGDGDGVHASLDDRFTVRRLWPRPSNAPCTDRCAGGFHYPPCGQAEAIAEASGW